MMSMKILRATGMFFKRIWISAYESPLWITIPTTIGFLGLFAWSPGSPDHFVNVGYLVWGVYYGVVCVKHLQWKRQETIKAVIARMAGEK
jgi:hypothetical protein